MLRTIILYTLLGQEYELRLLDISRIASVFHYAPVYLCIGTYVIDGAYIQFKIHENVRQNVVDFFFPSLQLSMAQKS